MDTQTPMPPSGRDFEVYRLVRIEEKSTREAARAVGVSQTRVCQILPVVEAFLLANTPDNGEEMRARRLDLALSIAAARVDLLYRKALDKFESTDETYQVSRQHCLPGQAPRESVTQRGFGGECRFLNTALRLSTARAKMAAIPLDSWFVSAEDEEPYECTCEDCSAEAARQQVASPSPAIPAALSLAEKDDYVLPSLAAVRPKSALAEPVQSAENETRRQLSPRDQAARKAFLTHAS